MGGVHLGGARQARQAASQANQANQARNRMRQLHPQFEG